MTSVLLIYPYFKPRRDRSVFRFPPLGISYVAASLLEAGHEVDLLDCTFLQRNDALDRALAARAEVVGIYCMSSMLEDALRFAAALRDRCQLLVAGGPLPTCDSTPFLGPFDIVVRGEGEQTMVELLRAYGGGFDLGGVPGLVYRKALSVGTKGEEGFAATADRPLAKDLDRLPFPARQLLPNDAYIRHGRKKYGYSITTVMSTRGCPFRCEFCSNVIHGGAYAERSAQNVVDEIEGALRLGYDRISFADDVFTLDARRVVEVCREIKRRGLRFQWECLGRVDAMDAALAREMKEAGCARVFFGIESGSDRILKLMNKKITVAQARSAVEAAHRAGLQVGAFFILFYPGDTDDTVIETLHFAASLPLDYAGLTKPNLLPGTALAERVKGRAAPAPRVVEGLLEDQPIVDPPIEDRVLTYTADFSGAKMQFGILKGHAQFRLKRRLGRFAPLFLPLFEKSSDALLRLLR